MQCNFTCQLEKVMGCAENRDSLLIRIGSGEVTASTVIQSFSESSPPPWSAQEGPKICRKMVIKQPFADVFAVAVWCPNGNDGRRVKGSKCKLNGLGHTHVTNLRYLCKGLSCWMRYSYIHSYSRTHVRWDSLVRCDNIAPPNGRVTGHAQAHRIPRDVLIIRRKMFWYPLCIISTRYDS